MCAGDLAGHQGLVRSGQDTRRASYRKLGAAGTRHEKGQTQGPGPLVKIKYRRIAPFKGPGSQHTPGLGHGAERSKDAPGPVSSRLSETETPAGRQGPGGPPTLALWGVREAVACSPEEEGVLFSCLPLAFS